jgi:hypothetical protein
MSAIAVRQQQVVVHFRVFSPAPDRAEKKAPLLAGLLVCGC